MLPRPPLPFPLLARAIAANSPACGALIPCTRGFASASAVTAAAPKQSAAPSSTSSASTSSLAPPPHWLAEVRRYTLHPASSASFLAATSDKEALALRATLPFVGMWTTEAGGGGGSGATSLQTVTHLYLYESVASRSAARARLAAQAGWGAYLAASRPAVATQTNELVAVPAAQARALLEKTAGGAPPTPPPIFELLTGLSRTQLRAADAAGAHDAEGASLLLSGTVVVGEGVGSGVQLWRHPSIEACLAPRLALGGSGDSQQQPRRVRDLAARADRALLRAVAWSPLQ